MKINTLLVGLVFSSIIFLGSLSGEAQAKTNLTMAAMGQTSDTYMIAMGWSNVLNKTKSEVSISPLEGGGVVMLARGMAQGKWDIGFISTPHYLNALEGKGEFSEDPSELREKYKDFRALFGVTSGFGMYVVRADSGIRTIADLKGKKVAIGRPGGGGAKLTPLLLKAHGLEPEDYKAEFLDPGPALDEMRNNRLDCAAVWGSVPQAALSNFASQFPIHFVSLTDEGFKKFRTMVPKGDHYVLRAYKAETLKEAYGKDRIVQEGNVFFWTFPMQVIVRKDMPENVAYEIVKAFWENLDTVKATGVALANLNKDDGLESLSAQIHPGAMKYYKEKKWLK